MPSQTHAADFADDVRAFNATLDAVLDAPPQMLTRNDLTAVGSLTTAVYVIRARYENLYRRGALKA